MLAQENYRTALEEGLLKIMSKMGICTLSAYRGSELFEVIGLSELVCRFAFRYAPRRLRGVGFEDLARQALERHAKFVSGNHESGGFYKHRRGEDTHITGPKVVLELQKSVRSGDPEDWERYLETIGARQPALIRDLLTFVQRDPIPLEEVEPAEAIVRRFTTAAMSLGALSKEAHEALAQAMNLIGGRSNSGEGGEDPARFDTPSNSAIKQVASGRFGVTPAYLYSADELQIKMAQGSKPGEGGQLPGHKVTTEIARLRHTEPGVTLISPPPHHDIYSIEDLAQLIYDLKAFKPRVRVSVKLVSEPGVNRPGFCDCCGYWLTASRAVGVLIVEPPFVFGGCGVAGVGGDLAVEPVMVEPIDVGHGGELDIVESPPRPLTVDQFPLVEPDERLGQSVVLAVASRSDRSNDVVFSETFGVSNRQILHSHIGVVDQSIEVVAEALTVPYCHLQRVDRQIRPE